VSATNYTGGARGALGAGEEFGAGEGPEGAVEGEEGGVVVAMMGQKELVDEAGRCGGSGEVAEDARR
jgi:hypothetical protein